MNFFWLTVVFFVSCDSPCLHLDHACCHKHRLSSPPWGRGWPREPRQDAVPSSEADEVGHHEEMEDLQDTVHGGCGPVEA